MLLKIIAVSAITIGLTTSTMAQTAGSAGQGSGTNSGAAANSTNSMSGGNNRSMNSGNNGSGNNGTLDESPANSTNMNGQNSGASGGDPNDCQRQHAGSTSNPSPTPGGQSKPDATIACN